MIRTAWSENIAIQAASTTRLWGNGGASWSMRVSIKGFAVTNVPEYENLRRDAMSSRMFTWRRCGFGAAEWPDIPARLAFATLHAINSTIKMKINPMSLFLGPRCAANLGSAWNNTQAFANYVCDNKQFSKVHMGRCATFTLFTSPVITNYEICS